MHATQFRSRPLSLAGIAISLVLALPQPLQAADPERFSLSPPAADGYACFTFDLPRPPDMGDLTIETTARPSLESPAWPRMPELVSRDAAQAICYLDYERIDAWSSVPRREKLSFIGRTKAAGVLDLTLRYPLADGTWNDAPVQLALDRAELLPTPTSGYSPAQRWALAQVRHFALLSRCVGDFGGFCAFAAERTAKRFEVDAAPDFANFPRRGPQGEDRLYAVATGALAIQESLQLDRMTDQPAPDDSRQTVEIATIPAVEVESHPFDKMRGDGQPVDSPLAALVPEEFYFVRFARVAKLLEVLAIADQWGGSLLRLADAPGIDYSVVPRIQAQLALTNADLEALDPLVAEIGLVGSDPYLVDGSDVTVLLRPKDADAAALLATLLASAIKNAQLRIPAAESRQIDLGGVTVAMLTDTGGQVNAHFAGVQGVYVLSNSRRALERILAAAGGRCPNLAAAADYKYMRAAIFPLDDREEDGFIYLSDSFIRAVVGPEIRIKQQRRLLAAARMKRFANGMLLCQYEHGPGVSTLTKELFSGRYVDPADQMDLLQPGVSWTMDGPPRHTTWGQLGRLTPLIEVDATHATEAEQLDYAAFRDRYQQYWRTYFDPIAVRIRTAPALRFEVCILPLINASAYTQFAETAGGPPIDVPIHTFSPTTLFRAVMKFADGDTKRQAVAFLAMTGINAASDWLGDWVTFWVEDTDAFLKLVRREYDDAPTSGRGLEQEIIDVFDASFVLGIHVKNKISLATFLIAMRSFIQQSAPETVVFGAFPPYKDVTIVQIAPDPRNPWIDRPQPTTAPAAEGGSSDPGSAASSPASETAIREVSPAIYYATIGDGFYLSTQASALRSIVDRSAEFASAQPPTPRIFPANVLVYAAPAAAERIRPTVSFILEQRARATSIRNMAQLWLLGRCGALTTETQEAAAAAYLGCRLICPHDGHYTLDPATGEVTSSVHGNLRNPRRFDAPPADAPLTRLLDSLQTMVAALRFTEDGLMTTVEIERR